MAFEEKNSQWYAVRCCCQPTRLYGFLLLPVGRTKHLVRDRIGTEHEVTVALMSESVRGEVVTVTTERAIYSDDRPIEFWRTLPEFVEITHPQGPNGRNHGQTESDHRH